MTPGRVRAEWLVFLFGLVVAAALALMVVGHIQLGWTRATICPQEHDDVSGQVIACHDDVRPLLPTPTGRAR